MFYLCVKIALFVAASVCVSIVGDESCGVLGMSPTVGMIRICIMQL